MRPDPTNFELDLPDPFQDELNSIEFIDRLEKAWSICDKFDLQTEIWRGKILKAIRDREKRAGAGRGGGFLQWLREMEISKTRAYALMQLSDSSDELVGRGLLKETSVNNFSRRAFIETAQSAPEVQQMIAESANEGNEITRKQVRRLSDEFTSATSELLPEEIRERAQGNLLPSKVVAPLVKELAKLPENQQEELRQTLKKENDIQSVKDVTNVARCIAKAIDASLSLRTFQKLELNLEKATQEAQRINSLGFLTDAFGQAKTIESSVLRLYTAWKRLYELHERLWLETGSSTPHLRNVLNGMQTLTGSTMKVSMGELAGGKTIRLQIVEESKE